MSRDIRNLVEKVLDNLHDQAHGALELAFATVDDKIERVINFVESRVEANDLAGFWSQFVDTPDSPAQADQTIVDADLIASHPENWAHDAWVEGGTYREAYLEAVRDGKESLADYWAKVARDTANEIREQL